MQNNLFEEVKRGRWQAVALNTLPLFPDTEILVGLYAISQVNGAVEFQPLVVELPYLLGGDFLFCFSHRHSSFPLLH